MTMSAATLPKASTSRSRGWQKFRRNRAALVGLVIVSIIAALAILAPVLPIADHLQTSWTAIRKPPSAEYWMGSDDLGRDILSRMIWGAQSSLLAGVVSVTIAVVIGVPIGLIAGYFGGWTDIVISRFTDALLALPFLVMAIALAAFLGPSLTNAMIAIGLSATPIFIRLTRGQVLAVRSEEYIEGARSVGLGHVEIMSRYVLPNILPPIIVQATLTIAAAILAEASLSFLGLGQQAPEASWGSMLSTAKNFLNQAPWMAMWPGAAIFLVVIGFNLLGDGLRDALDPREN
ncbi:ABC transporter permease [Aureimonas fodinaquatilis]|uniref:ABC transporter permease n=1 Tax=Aureimonas fodinaquatilis TaxID=2565783 RepID=A0A5B0DP23_9HYPH|nr:ABC transporter permease [Aureimonas fodinaquatilis]KAA0968206.1 ABC transporter permease [Aureimonas fodinaquatilis]